MGALFVHSEDSNIYSFRQGVYTKLNQYKAKYRYLNLFIK